MTHRQLIIARILFVAYLVTVAFLCFGKFDSSQDVPKVLWGIPTDKIVHFLMFLPFPVLAYFAFNRFSEKVWSSILWMSAAFIAGCAFAAGTEWVQSYLAYRTGDPADFKADFLAITAGTVIVLILYFLKHRK
ncbi:MAG: VanZ family protein [Bacteroidales bacterium]|nr:VanZ family protein [Bacteroidales bacterium]